MSTTESPQHLTDDEIETTLTTAPVAAATGPRDADGTDGDAADSTDGDSGDADGTDGDSTDAADGDSGDADGTDA